MWMQILAAAGLPVIGEQFPGNWQQSLRQANPHGFYESLLRHGVYYRTNPHPATGEFVRPADVRGHAVKIFIPGLLRTDFAYLDRVIVTVRSWREYESSVARLHALEDEALEDEALEPTEAEARRSARAAIRMPPALEWWDEHYALVRDLAVRGYACHVQSYDGVVEQPRAVLSRTFEWLGIEVDLEAAIAAVHAQTRTQRGGESSSIDPTVAEVFDAFYGAVHGGGGLDAELIERMNATHQIVATEIAEHRERIALARGLVPERPTPPDDGPFVVLPGEWS